VKLRVLAVALLALASCSSAGAYTFEGKPWRGGTIRYYNEATDQAWAVARSVYVWNHSGARVQFVPTTRESAQLVIKHFPDRRCVSHAQATVGFTTQAVIQLTYVDERSTVCNSFVSVQAVAHELGHVLGLGHETRGCALMNPSGTWQGPHLCPQAHPWTWNCGLLQPDDVNGAIALYGGRPAAQATQPCTNAYTAISPPALRAEYRPEQLATSLRIVRPTPPTLPRFIASRIQPEGAYAFASAQKRCPSDAAKARTYRWSVRVGYEMQIFDRAQTAGRYCYAVWALDGLGRPSDRAAVAWVDVPAPVR
jgi:hypothetical protein